MRFGAQRYELKRSIANDSEFFRHSNSTSGQYQTSNTLFTPSPTHTTTVQGRGQVFMPPTLKRSGFYAPTLKKLKGHIALGLSVHASIRVSVRTPIDTNLR